MISSHLFDLPCLVVVLSAVIGSLISSGKNIEQFLRLSALLCLPVGIIGSQIGWIKMLSDMTDPSAFGPASSVATLPVLYAFILLPIFLALGSRCSSSSDEIWNKPLLDIFKLGGGFGFISLILLAAMIWKSHLMIYINIPSVLFIGLLVLFPTMLHGKHKTEGSRFLSRCIAARDYSILGTISASLIGGVGLLRELGDPTTIGPNMAMILLSSLYCGLILIGSTMAYQVFARKEIPNALSIIIGYVGVSILNILLMNAVILWTFSEF